MWLRFDNVGDLTSSPVGRWVDLDDVVTAAVIVARLGWRRHQQIHGARSRGFPEAARVLPRVSLWLWPDVRAWALESGWSIWAPDGSSTERVLVEPGLLVSADLIGQRLGIDVLQNLSLEIKENSEQSGPLYAWTEAEARTIVNRARRG